MSDVPRRGSNAEPQPAERANNDLSLKRPVLCAMPALPLCKTVRLPMLCLHSSLFNLLYSPSFHSLFSSINTPNAILGGGGHVLNKTALRAWYCMQSCGGTCTLLSEGACSILLLPTDACKWLHLMADVEQKQLKARVQ